MTKPITPITPDEATGTHAIPDIVIEVVNALIIENLKDGQARVEQREITERVCRKLGSGTSMKHSWLNFENAYENAGWNVEYDKPGYNETYPAFFIFKRKKGRA